AARLGEREQRVHYLLPLANLGPETVRGAFAGSLPARLALTRLLAAAGRLDWSRQRAALGLART
ncbi:MAG: recombinase family protein, partial [Planctomycetota bacterium]|nr:recombinase family protein [Planctomycetota bacterium]